MKLEHLNPSVRLWGELCARTQASPEDLLEAQAAFARGTPVLVVGADGSKSSGTDAFAVAAALAARASGDEQTYRIRFSGSAGLNEAISKLERPDDPGQRPLGFVVREDWPNPNSLVEAMKQPALLGVRHGLIASTCRPPRNDDAGVHRLSLSHSPSQPQSPVHFAGYRCPAGSVELGRYEVEARAGEGIQGVVFRARDIRSGGRVALKMLRPECVNFDRQAEMFDREAAVLHHLGGGIAPRLLQYEQGHFGPVMVTEWAPGAALNQYLDGRSPPTAALGCRILERACAALAQLHERGIVHQDIKPEHLIAYEDGGPVSVRVVDFGVARHQREHPSVELPGTLEYLAPELFRGAWHSPMSDQYAFGLVARELFSGRRTYHRGTFEQVGSQKRQVPAPPIPDDIPVPASVRAVIARMCARNPDHRFKSMAAAHQALRAAGPIS